MSGPIVRKYGFPNFDNIFGKRELEHGVEETSTESEATASDTSSAKDKPKEKPKASKKKSS